MRVPERGPLYRDISTSMTPMIDVVFLLLVYFLCTASFQQPEQVLPTPLPPTGSVAYKPTPEEIELGLVRIELEQRANRPLIRLNGRPCPDMNQLRHRLAAIAATEPNLPVVLDISPEVMIEHVIDAYEAALAAGLKRINFAASEEP